MSKPSRTSAGVLDELARSFTFATQAKLRERVKAEPTYYGDIAATYLQNPFLRLTDDEAAAIAKMRPRELAALISTRHAAARGTARNYVVFCMPKSGSSFVQSALQHALGTPFVSLTSFGSPETSSYFGMNSREQEVDELAVIRAILSSPDGFVAQHHTRYSTYLALQMELFRLTPIVTVRNVLDCIVSFDDMMLAWRQGQQRHPWVVDAQFALPVNYPQLADETRYTLLAHSFGVWLINFYLSWKRARGQGLVAPVSVRYEEDVLQPEALVERLAGGLDLSTQQRQRLEAYVRAPDRTKSRLNVGRRGRGAEKIPERLKAFLAEYAELFAFELDPAERQYLVA